MLATSLPLAQWLERPTDVRKVMRSIPVGDSDFSLSHARDVLNTPSFLKTILVPFVNLNLKHCTISFSTAFMFDYFGMNLSPITQAERINQYA